MKYALILLITLTALHADMTATLQGRMIIQQTQLVQRQAAIIEDKKEEMRELSDKLQVLRHQLQAVRQEYNAAKDSPFRTKARQARLRGEAIQAHIASLQNTYNSKSEQLRIMSGIHAKDRAELRAMLDAYNGVRGDA